MRLEPRYAFQVPVALLRSVSPGTRQEIGCKLEDLSLSGLRISLKGTEELSPGEQVYLTLTIREEAARSDDEGKSVSLKADVMWRRERDCGLKIVSINDSDLSIYRELIESLKS